MAGYNGYSMSNNAVAAYDDGLLTASKIKEVPASLIKIYCRYKEMHHTSKMFNMTEFYEPAEVLAIFGLIESKDYKVNVEAVEALKKFKENKNNGGEVIKNCEVEWLEWSGSLKHPKATKMKVEGCQVLVKGVTAIVKLLDGRKMVKRLKTRGFKINGKEVEKA